MTEAMALYRCYVFGEGIMEGVQAEGGPTIRPGIDPERVREVLTQGGRLSWGDFVRCRVRYFTDAAVFGSKAWVNGVFEKHRERLGPKRKDGARTLKGLNQKELFVIRDLRIDAVTVYQFNPLPMPDSK